MTRPAVPVWFWVLSVILLLWSLMGVGAFAAQVSMGPAQLAQLPEAQRNAFSTMPTWAWAAYGIGTIAGLAAAICLILRRQWAVALYLVSLIAVLAQFGWTFFGFRILDIMSAQEAVPFPALIIVIAIVCVPLSHNFKQRGWLN